MVQDHANKQCCSMPAAYDVVEASHLKQFGARKYVNYDSFRFTNYENEAKQQARKKQDKETNDKLFDILESLKNMEINPTEAVRKIKAAMMSVRSSNLT
jgi:hypothetical protein